ncbi:hypothetical protein CW357_17230 [Rummeliibacillus sp. TYF005]|uniref:hypothetical protein n=1 Tax=Rummeliibacillus sp. TYF005 TaxID=2058214 RepID=UPI000F54101B|nr:hypothetical protein [Rummeliibacillus sp. TYF005]RPJ94084.1 hypothetical protein CW357_17230 [Rummeliibacillus sp. TYF005]
MNNLKKYGKKVQDGKYYLTKLKITKWDFKELSTQSKRTGSMGKTKPKWRESDGIDYPVITYNASELKGVTSHA